jgi:hypothetical protein
METNPIIEKVQAILDRANHPNTPQAEAETALAMAQKLMLKHGLDEAVLAKARKTDEVIVRETLDITGTWGLNRARLFYVIAQQVNVACYRSVVSKKLVVMTMYGTASDIFTAKTLFASAEMLATRLIPRGNRSFRHSWWLGFISGVSEVLRKSKREFIAEQGTGTELCSLTSSSGQTPRCAHESNSRRAQPRTRQATGTALVNRLAGRSRAGRALVVVLLGHCPDEHPRIRGACEGERRRTLPSHARASSDRLRS